MFEPVFSKRYGVAAFLAACLILSCGCENDVNQLDTAAVSGVVTVDGAPLNGGSIIFTPEKGRSANGKISSDGEFSLHTYGRNDGAIVGLHKVAIISAETGGFESNQKVKAQIPSKYFSAATSGLTFEVKSSTANDAKFDLSSK